jgi:hypothetical protein
MYLKMKDFAPPLQGKAEPQRTQRAPEILVGRYSGAEARSFCAGFGTTESRALTQGISEAGLSKNGTKKPSRWRPGLDFLLTLILSK